MTISSSIELYDNFSGVFTSMTSAMNLMLSGIDDIQAAMASGIDTSFDTRPFDAGRESLREAESAVLAFQEEIEKLKENSSTVPPIKVPVEWVGDTEPPVFTTTGVERYEQEISNANTLMNDLVNTQVNINANAVNVLSPSAITDLTSINTRMTAIQQRIQQIESNPLNVGSEAANAGLENLRRQLAQAQQAQSQLNTAVANMDVGTANAAYARLSSTISNTERYIRDNVTEQGAFNNKIAEGSNKANDLMSKLKGAAAAYISLRGIGSAINLSDEITQTDARLSLMIDNFDETGSVEDLFNKVYASAQDARGSLTETAAVIARFGNNAKDAFSGTDEVVEFANLVQKQMTIAGATTSESSNAMLQLSQALGSGVLRGDELNSIFENAPNLIQNIADYLGEPIGQIREMAADGELTADVVKNAIFAASDEINERFNKMPMTWGQMWTKFQNTAVMAFKPVLDRLNDLANSEAFQSFVENAITVMAVLANVVIDIFELIGTIGSFIADHWNVIGPIIYGVVAALAVYYGWLALIKVIELISTGVKIALCIASFAHAAATGAEASATAAATAAQYGLNTAILACPIFWIIILIIALIAVLIAVCDWIAEVTGAAESALGIICGALAVAGAFIWNTIVGVINGIIQLLWTQFVEPFIGIIEWILNVCNGGFDSFGDAVANLVGQIISWFLSLGKVVTKIIDAIFGTDWTAGLTSLQDSVLAWGKNENAITLSREAPEIPLQRIEYGTAWDAGVEFGDNISNAISNGIDNLKNMADDLLNPTTDSGEDALNGIKDNTDDIKKEVKNSDDILSMIKDSISKERIASYTTKQINVDMSGMSNKIESSLSIGDVVREFEERIAEAASASAEGV
ncbi:MAG: tape measure protein [Clostridia bacterium]|nr:tape measure protein [Clostridia bacterium]